MHRYIRADWVFVTDLPCTFKVIDYKTAEILALVWQFIVCTVSLEPLDGFLLSNLY